MGSVRKVINKFDSPLELGGMIQAEVHHSSGFGIILNYAFMDLGEEASGPQELVNLDVDIFQGVFEGFLNYRHKYEGGVIDAYAGARWWDIEVDLTASTPGGGRIAIERGGEWVDPVIGTRWAPQIATDWRLMLQGDIGGFNVSSDFTYNLVGGFLWDAWERTSIAFLYRFLAVDYERGAVGTPNRFAYDTNTQGPILGVSFRF